MDLLLTHLERSARQMNVAGREAFVLGFDGPSKEWFDAPFETGRSPADVLGALWPIMVSQGFQGKGPDHARRLLLAKYEKVYDRHEGWLGTLNQLQDDKLHLSFQVRATVNDDGQTILKTDRRLPTWVEEIRRELLAALTRTVQATTRQNAGYPHHPVLAPGEEIESPFTGNLRDYSGCARDAELRDLQRRDGNDTANGVHALPLGVWTFEKPGEKPATGAPLYLANYSTGAPMIYNGALVCAPQNSGKTQLIIRWAQAANAAGYSVFLIDVKGNLYEKLASKLTGKVYYFSTDPDEVSDRINFLSGVELCRCDETAPEGIVRTVRINPKQSKKIRQLVNALLPGEGWESGENLFYYQNRCSWLTAILHILKLFEFYCPDALAGGRRADLSDAYSLVSNAATLCGMIDDIWKMECHRDAEGGVVLEPSLAYWVNEISILLGPGEIPEGLPVVGQRRGEDSYRSLTQALVMALQPFSVNGTLFRKIRDPVTEPEDARGELFSFEQLGGDAPVTIILAAREQDLDDAVTVVSLAVKKLEQFLFERFKLKQPRPILLLLDETRRIQAFKPGEYITFAREAKAGCVLVYQSLDQIGKENEIMEVLENVGTQIYLKSLVGNTAKYFIGILPKRFRPTFSLSSTLGVDGQSSAVQSGQELVDYFTTNELYRLPAGEWPALVYIKDHASRKPFLVNMDERKAP